MGNFVSLAGSCPIVTANPTSFPQDDTTSIIHEPKLPPTPPPPTSSARIQRCALTASLASHTRRLAKRLCRLTGTGGIRLPDVEECLLPPDSTAAAVRLSAPAPTPIPSTARRRALLVGIAYHAELLNTHQDVDRYRDVLIAAYGYRPEDIIVLKDDPAFDDHLQPTRENILRELRNLVADAAAGDRFTFLFSGHSNQQPSMDLNEEDFMDEYIITIDDEVIIDNELNDILVKPLPAGSSLFALFDTCHSGTLLDLPHYHCNTVYVPWCSKGKRRTNSLQNVTVRRNAAFIQDPFLPAPAPPTPPTFSSILAQSKSAERMSSVLPIFATAPLSAEGRIAPALMEISARRLRDSNVPSSPLCASPQELFPCNGWCAPDPNANAPTVVSLAACSDDQRSWEAYEGSLTKVVCSFLGQNKRPSYGDLMTHINFKIHATSRQLHEWTRTEKTKAKERAPQMVKEEQADLFSEEPPATKSETFEGEMDNFQTPLLSSLIPLNMQDVLQV